MKFKYTEFSEKEINIDFPYYCNGDWYAEKPYKPSGSYYKIDDKNNKIYLSYRTGPKRQEYRFSIEKFDKKKYQDFLFSPKYKSNQKEYIKYLNRLKKLLKSL